MASLLICSLAACRAEPPAGNVAEGRSAAEEPAPPVAEIENAPSAAPEPAPIPAKFHGLWANTPNACKDVDHYSRLVISGRALRFPDYVIAAESVTFPKENQFATKGVIEGKQELAEAHYSLNEHGDLLRDEAGGGSVRERCP